MTMPSVRPVYDLCKSAVSTRRGLFLIAALCIIAGVLVSGFWPKLWQVQASVRIEQAARSVAASCKDASYRPTCYEDELPKHMDQGLSMEEAFEAVRELQRRDPQFVYCHVLGHKLSARETAKDPSKWKDVAARSPVGLCSYGGIHGAFQERFRSEWLTPAHYGTFVSEVADACKPREGWQPTGVEQASCMHAMGHLTMFVADGEVRDALSLCERIVDAAEDAYSLPLCYDGVFMQVFQPLEPEDFALVEEIRPKDETEAKRFCQAYTDAALSSCTSERWPYSRDAIERDPRALLAYCDAAPTDTDERFCFMKMVNLMTARKQFSPTQMTEYCAPLSGWQKQSCIVNATSRMLENDLSKASDALLMCEGASDSETAEGCWQHLAVMIPYSVPNESKQFRDLCQALPAPHDGYCLSRAPGTY